MSERTIACVECGAPVRVSAFEPREHDCCERCAKLPYRCMQAIQGQRACFGKGGAARGCYYCDRPECVKAQRDELRQRAERAEAERDKERKAHDFTFRGYEALKARLARAVEVLREAREDWIKVGYGASHEDVAACRGFCDRIDALLSEREGADAARQEGEK